MWKRIHSNRDPRDTIYSEVRKEFSGYFNSAEKAVKRIVSHSPRSSLIIMILLLIISAALSFTVFRHKDPPKKSPTVRPEPVNEGFDQIVSATRKLRGIIHLKGKIDSMVSAGHLSRSDSVSLNTALDSLAALQKTLKSQEHEH